jgi:hypothetical protein
VTPDPEMQALSRQLARHIEEANQCLARAKQIVDDAVMRDFCEGLNDLPSAPDGPPIPKGEA